MHRQANGVPACFLIEYFYCKDNLLDSLIDKEDQQHRQQLIAQLPSALATLTNKQRDAIRDHYYKELKKKQIATKMGISPTMAGRHVKAGLAKLRSFYRNK